MYPRNPPKIAKRRPPPPLFAFHLPPSTFPAAHILPPPSQPRVSNPLPHDSRIIRHRWKGKPSVLLFVETPPPPPTSSKLRSLLVYFSSPFFLFILCLFFHFNPHHPVDSFTPFSFFSNENLCRCACWNIHAATETEKTASSKSPFSTSRYHPLVIFPLCFSPSRVVLDLSSSFFFFFCSLLFSLGPFLFAERL